jgi:hypothetical protein
MGSIGHLHPVCVLLYFREASYLYTSYNLSESKYCGHHVDYSEQRHIAPPLELDKLYYDVLLRFVILVVLTGVCSCFIGSHCPKRQHLEIGGSNF